MTIPEQSKTHTIEKQFFHLASLRKYLQMKKQHILGMGKESFLGPRVVPYHVSSYLGNHKVFLGFLMKMSHRLYVIS
jgi:hypothetical protein